MTELEAWQYVYDKKLAVSFPSGTSRVCVARRVHYETHILVGRGNTIVEAVDSFIDGLNHQLKVMADCYRRSAAGYEALLPDERGNNE